MMSPASFRYETSQTLPAQLNAGELAALRLLARRTRAALARLAAALGLARPARQRR